MNTQYKKISELKSEAREAICGNLGSTIGATILFLLIDLVLTYAAVSVTSSSSILSTVMYYAIIFLLDLFMGIFVSGRCYMYMNVVYGQPVSSSDLFFGFKQHPDKAILIQLVISIISFICSLPSLIIGLSSSSSTLLMLGLSLLGSIVSILITISVSMVFYILQDFPDRPVFSIFKTSMRIMKGNKLRLIGMYISFIPLILLGIITFFIPLLWIYSYIQTATAEFYKNIIEVKGNM